MMDADELVREKHHDAPNIQRQVSSVEKRWQRFLTNVEEYRGLLEAAIEFYQLHEQVRKIIQFCNLCVCPHVTFLFRKCFPTK